MEGNPQTVQAEAKPSKFIWCQKREQRMPIGLPVCETCEIQCREYLKAQEKSA